SASGPSASGKVEIKAGAERVALIVIQKKTFVGRRKIRQAAIHGSEALGILVRISEMDLCTAEQAGRADGRLPAADTCAVDGEWEKDIGATNGIVIEKVSRLSSKVVHIQSPSADRNCHPELPLLVSFAPQRNEAESLIEDKIQQRTGDGGQGRRLI